MLIITVRLDRSDVHIEWERKLENKFTILSIIYTYTVEEPILQTNEYLHL